MVSQHVEDRMTSVELAAVLHRLPDGVAVFDADWTIGYANPAAARLLGRSAEELAGRNLMIALPELVGTALHAFLLHTRVTGGPSTWQGLYAPAGRWLTVTADLDGDRLQISLRAAPAHLPGPGAADGAVRTAAGIGADTAAGVGPAVGSPGAADPITDLTAERDRLRFLAEVAEAMAMNLDQRASATQLTQLVLPRLGDWAIVALLGEDGGRGEETWAHRDPARAADLDTYMRGRLRGTGDDAAMLHALLSGEPVQVTTIDQQQVAPSLPTPEVREAWRRLDLTSCTIVPLRARGETFGVLALMNTAPRPPHSGGEIATAVEVARRGALALDNARLFGRQQRIAETLQRSLLTPPPAPAGLQVAVRYRPASSHALIGGDFYDAFTQPDGTTVLVIGDVADHDLAASAAMSQLRSTVRTLAFDRPDSPAATLTRVDRVLTGLQFGTLATALLAWIDRPAPPAGPAGAGPRRLCWSSAGHPPPLLLHADGAVQVLHRPPERLLGTDEPSPRSDHTALLHPGDTVLLVTDGLIEHGRTGIDDGLLRLASALRALAGLPLEELCDRLLADILTGRADDDVALVAVRHH